MRLGVFTPPQLPHDSIPLATFLVVEKAIVAAWDLLRQRTSPTFNLATAHEDAVTHELYEVLFDEIFDSDVVSGFDKQLFTVVTREAKVRNYDGTKLDKMPDLFVGFVGRTVFKRTQDWLFIECKPVDSAHTVGVCYCSAGLIRFVDGRYAWTMTEAMMVGYARSGYEIDPKKKCGRESLKQALNKKPSNISTKTGPSPCSQSKATTSSEVVYITQHDRKDAKGNPLIYKETGEKIPDITIRHLWLKRN